MANPLTWLLPFAVLCLPSAASAADVIVHDARELRAALQALQPGTTLRIAPGEYPGGNYVSGIENLTIAALDPQNPPRFVGGNEAWHFSRCDGLTLRDLQFAGQARNGLNLDDGGDREGPARGITLLRIEISDVGPQGNHDGIKASGIQELTIRDCIISGWGGQGMDLVGCHQSLIAGCVLTGKPGFSASAGIQLKGGTADVTVEKCRLVNAGQRPLNIGGSTDLPYYRPADARHEAARIIVRDNIIEGSPCAAAFVGVDGAEFRNNTVLFPEKWIFRVLQETTAEGFAPCRNVVVQDNRIVFRRAQVRYELNIGPHTAPETFSFLRNRWFAEDRPEESKPTLPAPERDGVYGTDPRS